jgi:hypothetical protein
MTGVTLVGLLLTPVFYVSVRWVVAKVNGGHKVGPDLRATKMGALP